MWWHSVGLWWRLQSSNTQSSYSHWSPHEMCFLLPNSSREPQSPPASSTAIKKKKVIYSALPQTISVSQTQYATVTGNIGVLFKTLYLSNRQSVSVPIILALEQPVNHQGTLSCYILPAMTDISVTLFHAKKWVGNGLAPLLSCQLTAIVAECCELDSLLSVAGAVVDFHLQLVPGGLLQVVQDVALGKGGALCRGPRGRVHGPILQGEGGDGAPAVIPAIQVELDPSGVDAREQLLLFSILRFCGERGRLSVLR